MSYKPKLGEHMWSVLTVLPTDYGDYGGDITRWGKLDEAYPDCSCGCRWNAPLEGLLGMDWGVCVKKGAPRAGLLTWEHQAGYGCFEAAKEADPFNEDCLENADDDN